MVLSLAFINPIMPIVAFMFVFVLIYALLVKTNVIGDNQFVLLFLSFIVASFFIVNVQLVEFVKTNVSWFVVFLISLFMIIFMLAFVGKDGLKMFTESKGVAAVLVIILIIVFIFSSSYIFNWAINWDSISGWMDNDWVGMALLLIVAGLVSWRLTKK